MRRSIDDDQVPAPPVDPDDADEGGNAPVNWSVSICDDYDDSGLRVQLTVEEVGAPGTGLVAHLEGGERRPARPGPRPQQVPGELAGLAGGEVHRARRCAVREQGADERPTGAQRGTQQVAGERPAAGPRQEQVGVRAGPAGGGHGTP